MTPTNLLKIEYILALLWLSEGGFVFVCFSFLKSVSPLYVVDFRFPDKCHVSRMASSFRYTPAICFRIRIRNLLCFFFTGNGGGDSSLLSKNRVRLGSIRLRCLLCNGLKKIYFQLVKLVIRLVLHCCWIILVAFQNYLGLGKISTPSTLSYCDIWRSRLVLRVRCLIGNAGGWSPSSLILENEDDRSDELNLVDAIDTELRLLLMNELSMQSWLVVAVSVCSLSLHFEKRSSMPLVLVPPLPPPRLLNKSNVDVDVEFSDCDCWWYWLSAWCWWWTFCSLRPARVRADTLCILARIECIDTKPNRTTGIGEEYDTKGY